MRTSHHLAAGGFALASALAMSIAGAAAPPQDPKVRIEPGRPFDCSGQPCDAVARGFRAFMDRRLHGLDGNGRACADCHMPADTFQTLARERGGKISTAPVAAPVRSLTPMTHSSGRSMPMTSARTGWRQVISATCARTA